MIKVSGIMPSTDYVLLRLLAQRKLWTIKREVAVERHAPPGELDEINRELAEIDARIAERRQRDGKS